MFFHCARTWTFKALEVNFLSAHFFKSTRINVQVQLMKLKFIYCQKSCIFFTLSARAHGGSDTFKTKNACNMHNFKLACYVYTLFKFPGE